MGSVEEFKRYRERMNSRILSSGNLGIKRFFALDSRAYGKGALDVKTKEMLGLVASMVLRCNDCITSLSVISNVKHSFTSNSNSLCEWLTAVGD
jgi:alkylhydroperoxidase/carboxymuconolactone decarboxylase family protein YurZ